MIIYLILIGILTSFTIGIIIIPILEKKHINQNVSRHLNERHLNKNGTPTMGGLIFLISSLLIILLLYIFKKINFSNTLIIIILTFIFYSLIGFIDDYKKVNKHNNEGLSILIKLTIQSVFAIIIFFLYLINIGDMNLIIGSYNINIGFLYGFLIFLYLVGFSNAVNITDGLDGLATGLALLCFLSFGLIAFENQKEIIGIFCFVEVGILIGFLIFNFYPAKIFMGDVGSLSLGATLAIISILLKKEMIFLVMSICFIIELLSSFIQIIAIKYFNKRIFLKSPLHHHFEEKGYDELSIIKIFYIVNLIFNLFALLIE